MFNSHIPDPWCSCRKHVFNFGLSCVPFPLLSHYIISCPFFMSLSTKTCHNKDYFSHPFCYLLRMKPQWNLVICSQTVYTIHPNTGQLVLLMGVLISISTTHTPHLSSTPCPPSQRHVLEVFDHFTNGCTDSTPHHPEYRWPEVNLSQNY